MHLWSMPFLTPMATLAFLLWKGSPYEIVFSNRTHVKFFTLWPLIGKRSIHSVSCLVWSVLIWEIGATYFYRYGRSFKRLFHHFKWSYLMENYPFAVWTAESSGHPHGGPLISIPALTLLDAITPFEPPLNGNSRDTYLFTGPVCLELWLSKSLWSCAPHIRSTLSYHAH